MITQTYISKLEGKIWTITFYLSREYPFYCFHVAFQKIRGNRKWSRHNPCFYGVRNSVWSGNICIKIKSMLFFLINIVRRHKASMCISKFNIETAKSNGNTFIFRLMLVANQLNSPGTSGRFLTFSLWKRIT